MLKTKNVELEIIVIIQVNTEVLLVARSLQLRTPKRIFVV